MPPVRAIFEEVIERLLNGDMKDRKNSRGWNYVEELARQMLLDPKKAAELTAKASAPGCLPAIKASVERAAALNAPKLALLATAERCKKLGGYYHEGVKGPVFYLDLPYTLEPFFDPLAPSSQDEAHVYLPVHRNYKLLGTEYDGERYGDRYDDPAARAWHFRRDPREIEGAWSPKQRSEPRWTTTITGLRRRSSRRTATGIATALKSMGYATGQFGKNHLGDLNKYLPTVHGFDEYFGYLYHLDAMSDPFWYSYPTDPTIRNRILPGNLVHSYATDVDDETVQPRWGKIGKQRIVDEGPLAPGPNTGRTIYGGAGETTGGAKYDMTTFDEVVVDSSVAFMKKAKADGKPFFVWHNTTRSHVWSFLSEHYKSMMNAETNYGLEEAGMAQLDDSVGALLKALDDMGEANNTIVVFSTDNGAEKFTWPDGGMTPFRASKGTIYEGGFRVPAIIRWPGHVKPGTVENGIFSGLDWYPTFVAAAGNPNITQQLLQGVTLGDRTYKNHLDGYNQTV
jgi:hypothetical protein